MKAVVAIRLTTVTVNRRAKVENDCLPLYPDHLVIATWVHDDTVVSEQAMKKGDQSLEEHLNHSLVLEKGTERYYIRIQKKSRSLNCDEAYLSALYKNRNRSNGAISFERR